MKVYPILYTTIDKETKQPSTIVVEVFDNYDAAFDYSIMLAEANIKYGEFNAIEQPVTYEADRLRGFIEEYSESGLLVTEFSIWAETVRRNGWHA